MVQGLFWHFFGFLIVPVTWNPVYPSWDTVACPRTQSLLAFWSAGQVTEDWGPVGNRLPVTTRVRAIYRRSVWLFCDLLAISSSCCCLFASKMWENVPDFLELFRNFPVSISVLFVVPVVLLSGPSSIVMAAHEFPVFRMQQYDLHQTQVGKSTSVSIVKQRTRSWMVYLLARKVLMARLWFLCYKGILQRCFVGKKN